MRVQDDKCAKMQLSYVIAIPNSVTNPDLRGRFARIHRPNHHPVRAAFDLNCPLPIRHADAYTPFLIEGLRLFDDTSWAISAVG